MQMRTYDGCVHAYDMWTTMPMGGQQLCRSEHLCNAALSTTMMNTQMHCWHAQGYNSTGTAPGGPCP
jgi:hypothetical protein